MKKSRTNKQKQRWLDVTRLIARDGFACTICDLPLDRKIRNPRDPMYITFDHIVPRSHGGGERLENKRLAHSLCNSERGNDPVMPDEEAA